MIGINEMAKEVHQLAVEKGWWDDEKRNFGEIIALLHTEVSEAFEEWRNGHDITEVYIKDGKPEGVPIELADIAIRLLDNCCKYGIDLEQMILLKHYYNQTRPYRHGGKRA